jgi:hypothetical protein
MKTEVVCASETTTLTHQTTRCHNPKDHYIYVCIYVRKLRWAGHVARMGERRSAYRALVGKPEGRRPLERPRRRWEDNIKMDL